MTRSILTITMTNNVCHQIRRLAYNRKLLMMLLACWLSVSNLALVHAQQHYAKNQLTQEQGTVSDVQCQLCVSSFNVTPFIPSTTIAWPKCAITSSVFNSIITNQAELFLHAPANRGPPLLLL
jgi:hypothetical protein